MKKTFKRGFTLVELLVVISIIGLLAGLMLPAVNSAREQGRRATCINNQRNIALAFTMFEQNKGRFPQFRALADPHNSDGTELNSPNNVYSRNADGRIQTHIGWIPQLFPYVEQPQLYEEINKYGYTSNCDVAIELFFCKSAGAIEKNANNYVGNCGIADPGCVDTTGAYGLLTDGVGTMVNGESFLGKTISADDVKDGLSNTLLLSENLQAGNIWCSKEYLVGFCANSNTTNGTPVVDSAPWFNESETLEGNPGVPLKPNLYRDEAEGYESYNASSDSAVYWNTARMSSSHPGVVVAAMSDGSTRVISENVEAEILTKAMSPNDKATAYWKNNLFQTRTFDASKLND